MRTWLRKNDVSVDTCTKLQEETITTVQELKLMTREHVNGMNISLGEQIRLWSSIRKLQQMDN